MKGRITVARITSRGSKKTTIIHKTPMKQKIIESVKYVNLVLNIVILLKLFKVI